MKKLLIVLIIMMALASQAFAISMTRVASSTVDAGSTFTVKYTLATTENTFWSVEDTITGGCTPTTKKIAEGYTIGDQLYKETTFTSPSSGTCTFSGIMTYSTATLLAQTSAIPTTTVNIGGQCIPDCSCASNTCVGNTCSNGCPSGTCSGTKSCTCTPNWQCTAWSTCSGGTQTKTCTDANDCGTTSGKPAESKTCTSTNATIEYCEDGEKKQFWQTLGTDGNCSIATYVWILGGLLGFFMMMKMFK